MRMKSTVVLSALAAALAIAPTPVRADTFVTPFVGAVFGGDTEDPVTTYGGSVLFMGRGAGLELEFGYTADFFGNESLKTNVTTLMANYVAGGDLRGPGVKPYLLVGLGLIRTGVEPNDLFGGPENKAALNLGAGLAALFTRTAGIRGDIRYFRRLQGQSDTPLIPVADNFDFWRGAAGVTFRF